jgi:hypothetical protein
MSDPMDLPVYVQSEFPTGLKLFYSLRPVETEGRQLFDVGDRPGEGSVHRVNRTHAIPMLRHQLADSGSSPAVLYTGRSLGINRSSSATVPLPMTGPRGPRLDVRSEAGSKDSLDSKRNLANCSPCRRPASGSSTT